MKQNAAFRFTAEEMETAKGADLPDLLEQLGYSIRRVGSRYHCSYAPLGYRKAPDNHNKLVVDNETAWIVKRIFEYANAGMGSHKIASTLRKEQVPCPS